MGQFGQQLSKVSTTAAAPDWWALGDAGAQGPGLAAHGKYARARHRARPEPSGAADAGPKRDAYAAQVGVRRLPAARYAGWSGGAQGHGGICRRSPCCAAYGRGTSSGAGSGTITGGNPDSGVRLQPALAAAWATASSRPLLPLWPLTSPGRCRTGRAARPSTTLRTLCCAKGMIYVAGA